MGLRAYHNVELIPVLAAQSRSSRPVGGGHGLRTVGCKPRCFGRRRLEIKKRNPRFDGRKVDSDGRMVYMSLNIKNAETHRMARELARLTGESMTVAVNEAIRERLQRVRGRSKEEFVERIMKIGRECAARLKEPYKSIDHADLLYDENGLPK